VKRLYLQETFGDTELVIWPKMEELSQALKEDAAAPPPNIEGENDPMALRLAAQAVVDSSFQIGMIFVADAALASHSALVGLKAIVDDWALEPGVAPTDDAAPEETP
jgi:hypothetical protein